MPDLSHLKVANMPTAFAEMGRKHNELVALIESIEAATGLDIKVVHTPAKKLSVPGTPGRSSKQSAGRIRLGIKPTALIGLLNGASGGGTAQTVGIDGFLVPVQATGATTSNYPISLHVNNNGTAIDITGTGGVKLTDIATGSYAILDPFGLLVFNGSTGKIFEVDSNVLGHNINIATVNVCNGNVAGLSDMLRSAAY